MAAVVVVGCGKIVKAAGTDAPGLVAGECWAVVEAAGFVGCCEQLLVCHARL